DLTPWNGVLLYTERRHKEAVDDVLAAQVHTYNLIHRHIEVFVGFVVGCVKQTIGTRIGESPAKLFGEDAYLDIRWRELLLNFWSGRFAHEPDANKHNRRDDRPDQL